MTSDCEQRVAEIIARETGLPIEAVGRRPFPASLIASLIALLIAAGETGLSIEAVGRRPFPASSLMRKRLFDAPDKDHLRELSIGTKKYVLAGAAD